MGVETENYEIAAKGFENTRSWFAFLVVRMSSHLKGMYKSKSSLRTCEAEMHGWVSRMACSILSPIDTPGRRFTVQQILDAAFSGMKSAMPKLHHQAKSVMADGQKRNRISKQFDSQDHLCTSVIEQIRTHKRRHSEAESDPSFEAV